MRARQRLALVAACAAVLFIAGCGASGSPPTPKVNLSITVPTSGATVGVRKIVVAGTVAPATAKVLVGGQPAEVAHGSFTRSLRIAQPSETITVTAQASGYGASSASTTVQYSPTLAAQLVAANTAQKQTAVAAAAAAPKTATVPGTASASSKAVDSAFALPSQSTSTTTPTTATTTPTTATTTTPTTTTPTTPTTPTTAPTSTPTPSPAQTIAEIKKLYVDGCVKAGKSQKYAPYCKCTYNHLELKGALSTRARVLALNKELEAYERTRDPAKLPKFVRAAISACISKAPPPETLSGKPVITKLPGVTHGQVPLPPLPVIR